MRPRRLYRSGFEEMTIRQLELCSSIQDIANVTRIVSGRGARRERPTAERTHTRAAGGRMNRTISRRSGVSGRSEQDLRE